MNSLEKNFITNEKGEPLSTKLQIELNFVLRRLRILTVAIVLGILVIYFIGLFSPAYNITENFLYIKFISLFICILVCVLSNPLKKFLLKRVKEKNFMASYFNAIVFPMALCDFGGLFCIVTNLFLTKDILFSTVGCVVSLLYIYINFPSKKDLLQISFN